MPLDAVGTVDQENRVIEHTHDALDLGREVHMPRGIEQRQLDVAALDDGLLRVDGDAALLLDGVVVEMGVARIDAAELAHRPGTIDQRLVKRRLARVDMCAYPHDHPLARLRHLHLPAFPHELLRHKHTALSQVCAKGKAARA